AGFPLFAVATTAPVLQRWFSLSGHPRAHNPYFLFAAGNAGALTSLLCYPWIIEPSLNLSRQSQVWDLGFILLIVLITACGEMDRKRRIGGGWNIRRDDEDTTDHLVLSEPKPLALRDLIGWVALAFIPSSWLLGVTSYITTDLAAIPLFWTVPLALYMVTYIVAFARESLRDARVAPAVFPLMGAPLVMILAARLVYLF